MIPDCAMEICSKIIIMRNFFRHHQLMDNKFKFKGYFELFLLLALQVFSLTGRAQGITTGQAVLPVQIVQPVQVHAIIQKICTELDGHYPFPEISAKYVAMLKAKEKSYQNLDNNFLAGRITSDLQKVHKDVHLRVYVKVPETAADRSNTGRTEEEKLQRSNYGFKNVELDNLTSVAYISIPNGFSCTQEAFEMAGHAMGMAAYSKNIIIDVRNDGGGAGGMGHFLAAYFFEPGEEKLYLNGFERDRKHEMQEYTFGYVPGKRLTKSKLYILVNGGTGSACEGFAFAMQKLGRATIVGDTTAGAGIAGSGVTLGADLEMFLPVKMLVAPGTDTGWEGTGVIPDVAASSDDARTAAMNLIYKDIASDTSAADKEFKAWIKEGLADTLAAPDAETVKALSGKYSNDSSIGVTDAGLSITLNQYGKISSFPLKSIAKDVYVFVKPGVKKTEPYMTRLYVIRTATGEVDYVTIKMMLATGEIHEFPRYKKEL